MQLIDLKIFHFFDNSKIVLVHFVLNYELRVTSYELTIRLRRFFFDGINGIYRILFFGEVVCFITASTRPVVYVDRDCPFRIKGYFIRCSLIRLGYCEPYQLISSLGGIGNSSLVPGGWGSR